MERKMVPDDSKSDLPLTNRPRQNIHLVLLIVVLTTKNISVKMVRSPKKKTDLHRCVECYEFPGPNPLSLIGE